MIDPTQDGTDHINIYSKGRTELGRLLSNFAYTPIELEDGYFESLEGYWYWLLSSKQKNTEVLRTVHGWKAKELGRKLKCDDWPKNLEVFQDKFIYAMWQKLRQHPEIERMLLESVLPFKHYYVYKNKIIEPENCEWIIKTWEEFRKDIKYQ